MNAAVQAIDPHTKEKVIGMMVSHLLLVIEMNVLFVRYHPVMCRYNKLC